MGGVTMSSVLFDVPGPRTRARHRVYSILTTVILLGVLGWAVWKLDQNNQFAYEKWEPFVTPAIVSDLLEGLTVTLQVAAASIVLAIVFGMIFASGRLSDHWFISWPCFLVVEFFRAIPVLMMIFFLNIKYGSDLGEFWVVTISLTLYNGSVLAEVFRAGMLAVPKGQSEAGYSIGLRKSQVTTLILLPQAVATMLPAIISQCVVALKDSALAYVIPWEEIVSIGDRIRNEFQNSLPTAIVLAAVFIVINYSLSRLAIWLERRVARRGRTAARAPGVSDVGLGDQTVGGASLTDDAG
jgi:glutamate transport system permease protein